MNANWMMSVTCRKIYCITMYNYCVVASKSDTLTAVGGGGGGGPL